MQKNLEEKDLDALLLLHRKKMIERKGLTSEKKRIGRHLKKVWDELQLIEKALADERHKNTSHDDDMIHVLMAD